MRTAFAEPVEALSQVVAPGIDPASPYFSRLSARSALYGELYQLLDADTDRLTVADYRALVLRTNVLGRSSSSARAKLWQELKSRYRLDGNDPLFAAFWGEWRRSESDPERAQTAYVLLALNDFFVANIGTEWLFALLRRAPAEIRVADILAFIARSEAAHPEVRAWSVKTRLAVAQKYAASIRDFGLAKGTSRKATIRPALYASPVRLLIRAQRLAGVGLLDIVRARIFRLLALDETEVIDALADLNRLGAIRFRMQGDVVELDVREGA